MAFKMGPQDLSAIWLKTRLFIIWENGIKIMHGTLQTYLSLTGGRLNKKDGLTRYGNSHVKDKTS